MSEIAEQRPIQPGDRIRLTINPFVNQVGTVQFIGWLLRDDLYPSVFIKLDNCALLVRTYDLSGWLKLVEE